MSVPFHVLAFDGGGIRGLLTLQPLKALDETYQGFWKKADLFAGTSTGGLIALGLADDLEPARLEKLYLDHGAAIFRDRVWDMNGWLGPDHATAALEKALRAYFGDRKLGDLPRRVLIASFDLDAVKRGRPRRWKPKFFHNFDGEDSDRDVPIVDVALATCAAPTFFAAHNGYVDGGVVAGNPAMAAVAQALDHRVPSKQRASDLSAIRVLSFGTGVVPQYIAGNPSWGKIGWARRIVELMLEGNNEVADFQCRQLLRDRYWRVDRDLPPGVVIHLDDASRMQDLIKYGKEIKLDEAKAWIKRNWILPGDDAAAVDVA